jgi:hypothetical protein
MCIKPEPKKKKMKPIFVCRHYYYYYYYYYLLRIKYIYTCTYQNRHVTENKVILLFSIIMRKKMGED